MSKANVLLAMVREYFTTERQKAERRHQDRCANRYSAMLKAYEEFEKESRYTRDDEIGKSKKDVAKSFDGVFSKEEIEGYLPGDVMTETYGAVTPGQQASLAQLHLKAQQMQMQAQYNQALNAMNSTNAAPPTWLTNSVTGTGNLLGGVGVGGNHTHAVPYPGQLMANPVGVAHGSATLGTTPVLSGVGGHPYRSLGSGPRDTLFLALKGIEEAATKAPKGNHRYDHNAVSVLDMRNFSDKQLKVPLLGLLSFCVSNVIDPEGIIMLLRGYGLKVE